MNTPAGEILLKCLAPAVINEACVRGFIPQGAEFVSAACEKALTMNAVDVFRPLMTRL